MKKFSVLFILMALSMFALVFAAAAQTDLPAIDEEAAADYLGTWYMDKMCEGEDCFSISAFGIETTLELGADNTMTSVTADGEPQTTSWYMEEGTAYYLKPNEDGTDVPQKIFIDEDGSLVMMQDEGTKVTFVRAKAAQPGSGELVKDASIENFMGEWSLYGIKLEDDMVFPMSVLGLEGILTVAEETITLTMGDSSRNGTCVFEDYLLTCVLENAEDEEVTGTDNVIIEYHDDDSLLMTMDPGGENESVMIFNHGEQADTLSLMDLLQGIADSVSEGLADVQPEEEPAGTGN